MADQANPIDRLPKEGDREGELRAIREEMKQELTLDRLREIEEEIERMSRGEEPVFSLDEVLAEMEAIHRQGTSAGR